MKKTHFFLFMNLGIILIDGAANHTFNRTKRKCNWHVYYIKKVQNIVFKVVARASEAQIAIKAIKLHFQRAFAFRFD